MTFRRILRESVLTFQSLMDLNRATLQIMVSFSRDTFSGKPCLCFEASSTAAKTLILDDQKKIVKKLNVRHCL